MPVIRKKARISYQDYVGIFLKTGFFHKDTEFVRDNDEKQLWMIRCPSCANDEYAMAGVCDGIFFSYAHRLAAGSLPCRCATRYVFTLPQRKFQMQLEARKRGVKFIAIDASRTDYANARAYFECSRHGIFDSKIGNIITGRGCPGCAKYGFDPTTDSHLYVLKSECGAYAKIGISKDIDQRLSQLSRKNPFKFSLIMTFYGDGFSVRRVEKYIHDGFKDAGFYGFPGSREWRILDDSLIEEIKDKAAKCGLISSFVLRDQ